MYKWALQALPCLPAIPVLVFISLFVHDNKAGSVWCLIKMTLIVGTSSIFVRKQCPPNSSPAEQII